MNVPVLPLGLVAQTAVDDDVDRRALACCLDLLAVADAIQRSLTAWLGENGLSASKFSILAALADHDGQSPSALAKHLGVRRPTLTGLLDNLQTQGHIMRRQAANDRRSLSVHLSASGRVLTETAVSHQLARMATALAPLSVGERSALRKILAHVAQGLVISTQPAATGPAETTRHA